MFKRKAAKKIEQSPRRRQGQGVPAGTDERSDIERGQYTFRRNRTLTGSSSAKIASTTELNAELMSPRAHVHHLSSLRQKIGLFLVLSVVTMIGLYLLLAQVTATVSPQVSGVPSTIPQTDTISYQKTFEGYYSGRPIERLRFLANSKELTAYMQASHPEVKSVSLEPGSTFGEATAVMIVRKPVARWAISGKDSFVDDDGIVFSRNYSATPSIEIVDNSGIQTAAGKSVASDRFLGFVGRVIAQSRVQNLNVTTITIPALTTRQVVANVDGVKTSFKLSVDRAAGEQAEDMARVLRYMQSNKVSPEYVDLRVAGKAYYR